MAIIASEKPMMNHRTRTRNLLQSDRTRSVAFIAPALSDTSTPFLESSITLRLELSVPFVVSRFATGVRSLGASTTNVVDRRSPMRSAPGAAQQHREASCRDHPPSPCNLRRSRGARFWRAFGPQSSLCLFTTDHWGNDAREEFDPLFLVEGDARRLVGRNPERDGE